MCKPSYRWLGVVEWFGLILSSNWFKNSWFWAIFGQRFHWFSLILNEFIIKNSWFSLNFNQGVVQELIRNWIDFLSNFSQDFIDFDWILLWLCSEFLPEISFNFHWFSFKIGQFYYQILTIEPKSIIFIFVPLFINFGRYFGQFELIFIQFWLIFD